MGWRAAVLTMAMLIVPAAAQAGELTDGCAGADPLLSQPCRGVETAATSSARAAEVAAFERSWAAGALARQSRLGDRLPLADAQWVTTHNSFNSTAQMGPALAALDANQQLTLVEQLRVGIRSLELDVHWFLDGARGPVVCHGTGPDLGCSTEQPLAPILREIRGWLEAHPDEVVLLYLESHLRGEPGETAAVQAIDAELGSRVLRPSEGACTALPVGSLTRDAVRRAGKQVVLVSNGCGASGGWRARVFDWSDREEERPVGFQPFPACGPHLPGLGRLVRYYEDSTFVTRAASYGDQATVDDGIDTATARNMTDCGVDLVGFDHIVPSDGRLDAVVWTWGPGEPGALGGDCAVLTGGRWAARPCAGAVRPAACRAPDGSWSLSPAVSASGARAACAAGGAAFAVPRTGREGALLRAAAGPAETWLALRRGEPGF